MSASTLIMESTQLAMDPSRGMKREGFSHLKLFVKSRSGKREIHEDSSSTNSTPSPDIKSIGESPEDSESPHPSFRKKLVDIEKQYGWTVVPTRGSKPTARFNHAVAVVGRKFIVIGGETGSGTCNDVQMLHLGKLFWSKIGVGAAAPSKGLPIKTGPMLELPKCKGHSLIAWGKTVILIGGLMDPREDKISVWSFDVEMDSWTKVVTKGEVPMARSGQSVTRAGSILIMFGGEDLKGRKLNDLHILDVKSLMWLPLHPTGKGPSPRARHVTDMHDDRFLLVFGGETKLKISNDIYALDFDNMEWSRLKMKGMAPMPRAGHAGAMVGDKWYIAGGESRVPGILDTSVLDISRMEWSVVAPALHDSASSLQGLSVVFVQRKQKQFLVAFGGFGTQASNAVQALHIPPEDGSPPRTLGGLLNVPSTPDSRLSSGTQLIRSQQGAFPSVMGAALPCACVSVAKSNLISAMDHCSASQRSVSTGSGFYIDLDQGSGLIPLRKRYAMSQNAMMDHSCQSLSQNSNLVSVTRRAGILLPERQLKTSMRRRDLELPKLKALPSPCVVGSEGSERQPQSAQSFRKDSQSTKSMGPSVGSGLMISAEELQITTPSVRPGFVSSVGDAGTLFRPNFSSRTRPWKGSSQSAEFSGYAETCVPENGEEHHCEQSIAISTSSVESSVSWVPGGWQSSTNSSNRTTPEYEEDELTVLSKLQKAGSAEERSIGISKLVIHHERKLAVAIRKGELLAGQLAELFHSKDEAERTLHTVIRSRRQTEGRLAAALKRSKDLQDQLVDAEQAQEESRNLIHHARVESMKLEHDLTMKNAVLEDTQKELQSTIAMLISERTRAFQLQVELYEAKQKLESLGSHSVQASCIQRSILA